MSVVSGTKEPVAPDKVETLEVAKNAREDTPPCHPVGMEDEDDVYEDASDAGEVFVRRAVVHPPAGRMNGLPLPGPPMVGNPPPPIKPEMYDGTTDWSEYQVYFDQMSELFG